MTQYVLFKCPKCGKIRKYGKWVPYEEVRKYLLEHWSEWVPADLICPSCSLIGEQKPPNG